MREMDKERQESKFDIFIANTVFPEAKSLFAAGPQSLNSIKDDCIVVLDTNVLFIPFTTGQESLEQIYATFKMLVGTSQLIIPGQVTREFAKNRATKLAEVFQQLNRKMNSIPELQMGRYPLLESLDVYQTGVSLEKEINSKIREYRKALGDVLEYVRSWIWNDPVSLMYNDLFRGNVVLDPEFDQAQVAKDLEVQQLHKIPPGYKDAQKDDKGIGDVLIWLTILEIGRSHKKNVIFVTGDEKADWWYRSEKQSLYPRYELVDEFRRISEGKLFHMIHFSTFLNLYGASEKVVDEVRQKESASQAEDNEPNLLMAGFRIKIEKRLRKLAELNGVSRVRVSARMLLHQLADMGVIPTSLTQRFDEMLNACTFAVHGEPISSSDVELTKELAPELISLLDELILQSTNNRDMGESQQLAKTGS